MITLTTARCATSKYFQIIGSFHDIESYFGLDNTSSLNVQIFFCHWGHLAIIHLWLSANLFQLGWNANYELYLTNPIPMQPIAHGIWDAHIPLSYDYTIVLSYSAIYNVVCTVGFTNVFQIYNFVIICELLAACSIPLGKLHLISLSELLQWLPLNKSFGFLTTTTSLSIIIVQNNIRFNFHTGCAIGLFSIAWCGHLLHVAIPISRGNISATLIQHILCLTCNGGLNWIWTHSLYLTDIAHHHLSLGILFVWASHVYLSLFKAFGYRTRSVLFSLSFSVRPLGKSLHLKLAQDCTTSSLITAAINQHIYSLTPYLYLSYDYIRTVALYVHHSWIAEFLMIATFAHKAIFLIRDYTFHNNKGLTLDVIGRILAHKDCIISHLSWICLWLGFHTLGVYIHNDTFHAFGEQEKQILIEPTNAQIIQQSSGKANYGISLTYPCVHKSFDSFILPLGPGDLCAHHAIALGLHITAVILLKGALDGRGSKLMADKIHQH
jgi:photosystem I P700 chlorophyll a apoprotein A2